MTASLIAAASALAGVALKSLIDAATERRRNAREDRLRFLDERRTAYAALLLRCEEAAMRTDESRLEDARKAYSELLVLVNSKMREIALELMVAAKNRQAWRETRERFIEAAQRDLGTYSE